MARIERSVGIAAPPQRVFETLCRLDKLAQWSTTTVRVESDGEMALQQGHRFTQRLRIAAIELDTEWTVIEIDPPRRVVYEATSAGGGRLRMEQRVLDDQEGASRVELEVDYDLPGGFLGDIVNALYAERRNEREAEHSLHNLKDLVEAGT